MPDIFSNRMNLMAYVKQLIMTGLLVLLTACNGIGPQTIPRVRFDYASAITESWKSQMLRNIVLLRYGEPPIFMDVNYLQSLR